MEPPGEFSSTRIPPQLISGEHFNFLVTLCWGAEARGPPCQPAAPGPAPEPHPASTSRGPLLAEAPHKESLSEAAPYLVQEGLDAALGRGRS